MSFSILLLHRRCKGLGWRRGLEAEELVGESQYWQVVVNSSATVVKHLTSVGDTGILQNRVGFLLTLNWYLTDTGRLGLPVTACCLLNAHFANRNIVLPDLPNICALRLQKNHVPLLFMDNSE